MQAKIGNSFVKTIKVQEKSYEIWDSDLKGFLVVVYPSGKITYYCSFYRPQNKKRTRLLIGTTEFLTPAQARDRAKEILADVIKGVDPAEKTKTITIPALEDFLNNEYGPWVSENRKSGGMTLKRIKFCFGFVAKVPLNEITVGPIEKWCSERLKNGISKLTLNRDLTVLKAALAKAIEWNIIQTHPLAKLKLFRVDVKNRIRYLNDDEEKRLRKALEQREAEINELRKKQLKRESYFDHLKPMVLLCLNTGLRRGEIFKLRFVDINFSQKVLTVISQNAKSGLARHIPLNKEAYSILSEWCDQANDRSGLVFPSETGNAFCTVKTSWNNILKVAQIENFHFHDLRHTFASKLVMAGVDLPYK